MKPLLLAGGWTEGLPFQRDLRHVHPPVLPVVAGPSHDDDDAIVLRP
jgi:hypothetical protein